MRSASGWSHQEQRTERAIRGWSHQEQRTERAIIAHVWLVLGALVSTISATEVVVDTNSAACSAKSLYDMVDASAPGSVRAVCREEASSDETHHSSSSSLDSEPGVWSGQHIRSPLARAVYFKMKEDERNKEDRHVYWYRVIVSRLPGDLGAKFVQFHQDEGTDQFLENCEDKSNQLLTQLFYSLARPLLNIFMTQTSINGLLYRGSMFVFSRPQFEQLLGVTPYHKKEALLDLGAGDGMVTKQMSGYFHAVHVTEMSGVMVRRLAAQGFKVLGINEWQSQGMKYDLISCLNLLDRCDRPLTLLSEIKASLTPVSGRLLVAVVIPFKPYVEFDSRTHQPTEFIHIKGSNFEEQVESFEKVFRQSGFEVEKFSRLPYLCEGDLRHSFYVLTDAIFLLKAIQDL